MNNNLITAIRAVVEQVIAEKDLATKTDVAQAIAAELGLAEPGAPVANEPRAVVAAAGKPQAASQPARTGGRKPVQTAEERKAKRAAYQRAYRARDGKSPGEGKGTSSTSTLAAGTPDAQSPPAAPQTPKETPPAPPPKASIAYVPQVSLDGI